MSTKEKQIHLENNKQKIAHIQNLLAQKKREVKIKKLKMQSQQRKCGTKRKRPESDEE